ncbi:hypothetical protein CDL12_12091 [Handroanthus impetiginosus]|uniref:Uncharacterized protein n=1 Tax=Handroanthus impetiginosus TaxID=429701 RepID=A0A2G9HCN1_9LAMI|nr:hypothetical protein CDL12_12091 [Handroanthus impetiginosus]
MGSGVLATLGHFLVGFESRPTFIYTYWLHLVAQPIGLWAFRLYLIDLYIYIDLDSFGSFFCIGTPRGATYFL